MRTSSRPLAQLRTQVSTRPRYCAIENNSAPSIDIKFTYPMSMAPSHFFIVMSIIYTYHKLLPTSDELGSLAITCSYFCFAAGQKLHYIFTKPVMRNGTPPILAYLVRFRMRFCWAVLQFSTPINGKCWRETEIMWYYKILRHLIPSIWGIVFWSKWGLDDNLVFEALHPSPSNKTVLGKLEVT